MSNRYKLNGKWQWSVTAASMLRRAADVLRHSDDPMNRSAADLVDRSWAAVAARPRVADDVLARAKAERGTR